MLKLKQSTKILCISHIKDVDGCVCAALIRRATKSQFILTNYGNITQCLRRVENRYDLIYICDLGINESIMKEFDRIKKAILKHHGGFENATDSQIMRTWNSLDESTQKVL